jgi:hypothetical protein
MHSSALECLCTQLECYEQGWNAFYRIGMHSAGLGSFPQGYNAFDIDGIPLDSVGMLSTEFVYLCTGLKSSLECSIAFWRVGMLSTGLVCFRQGWHTFVQSRNAFYSVGMLPTELEYLCTGI